MKVRPTFAFVVETYDRLRIVVASLCCLLAALSIGSAFGGPAGREVSLLVAALAGAIPFMLLVTQRLVRRRIAEAQAAVAEALASAHRDALTGTFTRSYFLDELNRFATLGTLSAVG
jgi:hypothetical protein